MTGCKPIGIVLVLLAVACGRSLQEPEPLSLAKACAPLDPCPGATLIDGKSECEIRGIVCAGVTVTVRCHCAAGVVEAPFPKSPAECESLLSAWSASVCG